MISFINLCRKGVTTEQINAIIDQKLSSFTNLFGEALMERRESQKKIAKLEKKIKRVEEQNSELKHRVENQSLNIGHLESEANRVQKENEERVRVLEDKIQSLIIGQDDFEMNSKDRRINRTSVPKNRKNAVSVSKKPKELGRPWNAKSIRQSDDEEAVRKKLRYVENGLMEFEVKESE